jgi:Concanavalin A-like lectin/glucanases superfamily/HYR domain
MKGIFNGGVFSLMALFVLLIINPYVARAATMVGSWNFNDPSSSQNITDASGNDYYGLLTGATSTVTGPAGDLALNFDGTTNGVNLNSGISTFSALSEGTISLWFKTSNSSCGEILSSTDGTANYDNFDINIGCDLIPSGKVGVYLKQDNSEIFAGYINTNVADNEWHQFAYVVTGSSSQMYLDGSPASVTYIAGSATSTYFLDNPTSPASLWLGARYIADDPSYRSYYSGAIDNVHIYNGALSAGDIASLYTSEATSSSGSSGAMAPVMSPDVLAQATTSSGIIVNYTMPTAADASGSVAVSCSPSSGINFSIGATTVTCAAANSVGTTTKTFTVYVLAPTSFVTISSNANVTASTTNASGTIVTYTPPTATSTLDGALPVICSPASGTLFSVGTTTVDCSATDSIGNTATSTFAVIVTVDVDMLDGAAITGIDSDDSITSDLLWDGVDQGTTTIAQFVHGHYFAPTYNIAADAGGGFTPTLLPSTESTPIGAAIRWPGASLEYTNTGYGALGWLEDNFSGAQVYDSIKSATDLSNIAHPDTVNVSATDDDRTASALPPTGWTAATVYRQEGDPGLYTSYPGSLIFGRAASALETQPYSFWTFTADGYTATDTSATFSWDNNGTQNSITWSDDTPPLGSLVALVAKATTNITYTEDSTGAQTVTDVNGDVWSFGSGGKDGNQYGYQIYENGTAVGGVGSNTVGWIIVLDKDGRAWTAWGDSSTEPLTYNWYGLTAGSSGQTPQFSATVDFYGGIVGQTPTFIGSVSDQTIVGYDGNNESQIGWGSYFHFDTGYLNNVFDGNVFRGAFWGRPLTTEEITDYIANPDVYHTTD